MLDSIALTKVDGYCRVALNLMGRRDSDDQDDRAVLVSGGEQLTEALLSAFCRAASGVDVDTIYLEFGSRIGRGPRRAQVILPRDGRCYVHTGCAFWAPEDDGPIVLVPMTGHASHFVMTRDGIVHRPGKVAPSLASGIKRAARRLNEAAQEFANECRSDSVWIHA